MKVDAVESEMAAIDDRVISADADRNDLREEVSRVDESVSAATDEIDAVSERVDGVDSQIEDDRGRRRGDGRFERRGVGHESRRNCRRPLGDTVVSVEETVDGSPTMSRLDDDDDDGLDEAVDDLGDDVETTLYEEVDDAAAGGGNRGSGGRRGGPDRFDEEFDDLWDDLAEVDTRLTDIEDRLGEDLDDVEAELDAINDHLEELEAFRKRLNEGFRSITADRDDSIEIPREKSATRFTRGDPDPTMSEPVPYRSPCRGKADRSKQSLERIAAVGPDDRLDGLADRVSNTLRYEKAVTKGRVDAEDGPYERLIEYSDPDNPRQPEFTLLRDDRDGKPRRIVFDAATVDLGEVTLKLVGREEPFRALRTHEFAVGFDSADLVLEEVVGIRPGGLGQIADINERIDPVDTDVRVVNGLGDTVYHTLMGRPEGIEPGGLTSIGISSRSTRGRCVFRRDTNGSLPRCWEQTRWRASSSSIRTRTRKRRPPSPGLDSASTSRSPGRRPANTGSTSASTCSRAKPC